MLEFSILVDIGRAIIRNKRSLKVSNWNCQQKYSQDWRRHCISKNGAVGIQQTDVKLLQIECALVLFDELLLKTVTWCGGEQNVWTQRTGEKRKEQVLEKSSQSP